MSTQRKCRECGAIFIGTTSYCRICTKNLIIVDGVKKPESIRVPSDLDVGLIITTLNLWKYTEQTIKSLKKHTQYPHSLIVLDGASRDGTPEKIRQRYPDITLIELDRPYWVSYAWNRALEYGLDQGFEYIGILNNDILFYKKWLIRTLKCFVDDPNVGLASPIQWRNHGPMLDMGKNRIGYFDQNIYWPRSAIVPCTWMPGACFILRTEAIKDIGLFDEGFFFGNDEVDYCVRLWLKGWKVVSTSDAEINHLISKTMKVHGGNKGDRAQELWNEYGVRYKNHKQYFYEKWDTQTLEAIVETLVPEQDRIEGIERGKLIRIWSPVL